VIVVDAGVVVDLLIGDLELEDLGDDELAAPHLVDSEVMNALRRLVRGGVLAARDGHAAVDGFLAMGLTRFPAHALRRRMWELRDNLSAYDATYLALAERVDARALVTTDRRLAAAPGARCPVRLVPSPPPGT
jgi:predicted nucleic acid-binding protein